MSPAAPGSCGESAAFQRSASRSVSQPVRVGSRRRSVLRVEPAAARGQEQARSRRRVASLAAAIAGSRRECDATPPRRAGRPVPCRPCRARGRAPASKSTSARSRSTASPRAKARRVDELDQRAVTDGQRRVRRRTRRQLAVDLLRREAHPAARRTRAARTRRPAPVPCPRAWRRRPAPRRASRSSPVRRARPARDPARPRSRRARTSTSSQSECRAARARHANSRTSTRYARPRSPRAQGSRGSGRSRDSRRGIRRGRSRFR